MFLAKQHIGNREIQQDCYFCTQNEHYSFVLVADGLGGIPVGDVASKTIANVSQEILSGQIVSACNASFVLENIFRTAHFRIKDLRAKGAIAGHSTFAALLCLEGIAYVLHCGDSRVYHFRGKKLLFATKDHSLAERLKHIKKTGTDFPNAPAKNILYRCLGDDNLARGELTSFRFASKDWFLICSDGFWGNIAEEKLHLLYDKTNLTAEKLFNEALSNGAPDCDNITFIALYPNE